MPIFVERYLLPALVLVLGALVFTNPMHWELHERIIGGIADVLIALVTAHLLYRHTQKKAAEKMSKTEPPVAKRIFVTDSIDYLNGLVKGQTRLNRQKVVAQYIEKWLRIGGTVDDIEEGLSTELGKLSIDVTIREKTTGRRILLKFTQTWKGELEIKKPGDPIEAIGQIFQINEHSAILKSCELTPAAYYVWKPLPSKMPLGIFLPPFLPEMRSALSVKRKAEMPLNYVRDCRRNLALTFERHWRAYWRQRNSKTWATS